MLKLAPYACIALFLLLFLQVLQAWANHTVVNPDLKLPALGRYYEGDRVTILMDFSTGNLEGDEILDTYGTVGYDAHYTLQLIDPPDELVRPYKQGLSFPPNTDFLQAIFELPQPLTVGKWRITLDIFERKVSNNVSVFEEPRVWEIDVYPKPEHVTVPPEYGLYYALLGIAGSAAIGSLFYWRQKNSRTRPIIHWEYFQERVSPDGTVTKIRIRVKEGHAEQVRAYVNGYQLTWEKSGQKEFNMSGGDAGNLIIPAHLVSAESEVTLKWGKRGVMKERLGKIPKVSG